MLNEKGQRELCYVVKIDNIEPIVGSDNCEAAIVGGWKVMVRKNTFKVGDLAIYFEIDSKVPETREFEFLSKKHYKIKTQKYSFGGKGSFISQGLLMAFEDFEYMGGVPCWLANLYSLKNIGADIVGTFLTKDIGVTYSVAEDNRRKKDIDKYQKMYSRHIKLFNKYRWLKKIYNTRLGKKILFLFLGRRRDTRVWPSWVRKTDEERCLPGGTKILTDKGLIQISKIVNQKLDVKVASMDDNSNIVYKEILDYQKFNNDKNMITIKYPYRLDTSRTNSLCCTEDHKCYTERGYVEARNLTLNDKVYMPITSYNLDALSAIYGMLLGDSHIYDDKRCNGMLRIVATNGEKQLDYLKYKQSIFNNDGKITKAGIGSFGKVPSYHWFLNVDPYISINVRNDWYKNNKKEITDNVIEKINDIALAFWYMDDGCISYRNNEKTAYFLRLSTQGFSYKEIEKLQDMLKNKFNIVSSINKDKIAKDGHQMYRLDISSTEEADKFLTLVAPYVCDSMLYKLAPKFINRKLQTLNFIKTNKVFPVPILSIDEGQTKNISWGKTFKIVYDLEVKDTHNFIADNIVVHNCQNLPQLFPGDQTDWIVTEKIDGSSTTFTYKLRGKDKGYFVCSRNVCFDKPEKNDKCYYDTNIYLEMSEKYDIERVLKDLIKNFPDADFITLQGETYGAGVQKRDYSIDIHDFAAFNLIYGKDINNQTRVNSIEMTKLLSKYNIPCVPILNEHFKLPDTIDEMINCADGDSILDNKTREGVVLRTYDGVNSFKAVSNKFLLEYKE